MWVTVAPTVHGSPELHPSALYGLKLANTSKMRVYSLYLIDCYNKCSHYKGRHRRQRQNFCSKIRK